jgi:predicted ribosomally synthesized peptide with nif11-like leader
MSRENFERFRTVVVEDEGLQERLTGFADLQDFKEAVLQAGSEKGFDFTLEELDQAIREARQSWLERWIA